MALTHHRIVVALVAVSLFLPSVAAAQAGAQNEEDKPPSWRPLVGVGFSLLHDDHAEFEEVNGHFITKNDSRLRGTAMTGLGFDVKRRLGLFVGLEYAPNTTKIVDAVTTGFTLRLGTDAYVLLGYARTRGTELSPGFTRAAASWVRNNPGVLPSVKVHADGERLASWRDYDGLPLTSIGYPGKTLIESWNGSFFVGIALPVSVKFGSK